MKKIFLLALLLPVAAKAQYYVRAIHDGQVAGPSCAQFHAGDVFAFVSVDPGNRSQWVVQCGINTGFVAADDFVAVPPRVPTQSEIDLAAAVKAAKAECAAQLAAVQDSDAIVERQTRAMEQLADEATRMRQLQTLRCYR